MNKNQKICQVIDFAIPANHRVKVKKSKKMEKIPGLYQRAVKAIEHKGDSDNNHSWSPGNNSLKDLEKRLEEKSLEEQEILGWTETVKTTALLRSARISWSV